MRCNVMRRKSTPTTRSCSATTACICSSLTRMCTCSCGLSKRTISTHSAEIASDEQRFFLVVAGLREQASERVGNEGAAPELDAAFHADVVGDDDENTVGDRMAALHELPSIVLRRAEFVLLMRMPADGRR